jgi:RimJ/RimL family protein N-acetyltransferase
MEFESYHIRLISREDLPAYFSMIDSNRKRLEDFFAGLISLTADQEATKKYIDELMGWYEDKKHYCFLIIDKSNESVIGSVQLKSLDWRVPKAEVGYYIDLNYEGKGITSKAVSKVIHYGFGHLKLNKLFLRASPENMGSVKIAEKNGFEKEGLIRSDYRSTNGRLVDLIYFGLLNPEAGGT